MPLSSVECSRAPAQIIGTEMQPRTEIRLIRDECNECIDIPFYGMAMQQSESQWRVPFRKICTLSMSLGSFIDFRIVTWWERDCTPNALAYQALR